MNKSKQFKFLILLLLWGVIVLLFFLTRERSTVNATVLFCCCILFISLISNLFRLLRNELLIHKEFIYYSLFLAAVFIIQMSLSDLLTAPFLQGINYFTRILIIIGIYGNLVCFFNGILYLFCQKNKTDSDFELLVLCRICIIAESLLFIFSTYPAIWIQGDVAGVYDCAINQNWNDWHTIGYVLFVFLCTRIKETQYSVIIIQTIIWIVLNMYILSVLYNYKKRAAYVYTFIVCITITPFLYLESMIKDTVFSMGILALTVVLFKIIYTDEFNKIDIIFISIIPLFSILCRQGGFFVVIITYSAMILFYIKKKKNIAIKFALLFAFHGCVYLLVTVVLLNSLSATKNPAYVKYGTPMAMIGAAVSQNVDLSNEDIEILEQVMPLERWGECYNKYWADDISRSWGKIGEDVNKVEQLVDTNGFGKKLIEINAKLFLKHPIIYLRAFFDMNSIIWEIAKPVDAALMTTSEVPEDVNIVYSTSYKITNSVAQFMDQNAITNAISTRGGYFLFGLIFSSVVICILNKKYLLCELPIAIVDVMLAFTIPAQDPRYILPTIECSIFIFSIIIANGLVMKSE